MTSVVSAIFTYWLIAVGVFAPYEQFRWDVIVALYLILVGVPLVVGAWLFRTFIVRNPLDLLTFDLAGVLVELARLQWLCRAEVTTSRQARLYYRRLEKTRRRLERCIGPYGAAFSRLRGLAVEDTESSAWFFSRWISWVIQDCLDAYRLSEASKVAAALLAHVTSRRPYLPPPLAEPPRDAVLAEIPKWQSASRVVRAVASPPGLGLIALLAAALTATSKLI
ncbi:hypothetical protein GCM10027258_29110 [Amycolatopsis stemonae]